MTIRCTHALLCFFLLICMAACRPAHLGDPAVVAEDRTVFTKPPTRIVSLYPTASEIIAAIGGADNVVGVTIHDRVQPGLENKPMVGGFANPDMDRILALSPDLVIASPFHGEMIQHLRRMGIPVLVLNTGAFEDGATNIRLLGSILGREKEAEEKVAGEQAYLELAAAKVLKLNANPGHRRLRTVRLMGFTENSLMVPGDDSFQNEMIRRAGGQPPEFGKNGAVISLTPEQWRAFNPEAVYSCGLDQAVIREKLGAPEWSGVVAQKTGNLFSYPCDLTCRVATRYGYFPLWLSSDLYGKEYCNPRNQTAPDHVLTKVPRKLPFAYAPTAEIVTSRIFDFPAKTLLIRFTGPQKVLSSLSGWRDGVMFVGNHSTPSSSWSVTHHLGLEKSEARTSAALGLNSRTSTLLFTGADMDNLAYTERASDGLKVGVFATAGVKGNAMRAAIDTGNYVEPGTINLIVLTNRQLTNAAMTRALITVTEAKTAALEDLDIRSSYSGTAATGTGTDNVIVVAGNGLPANLTGGHVKLGELMATATYAAVREAIAKQNRLSSGRDIFQRLAERQVFPSTLIMHCDTTCGDGDKRKLAGDLETLLLDPSYAGFIAGALALSDSFERGLVPDTSLFSRFCLDMAGEVAGKKVTVLQPVITDKGVAPPLREALNALITGLLQR